MNDYRHSGIRSAIFFSNGDSNDPSVWSNVPYCFGKALEDNNFSLHRVNLNPPLWLNHLWNQTFFRLLRHFRPGHLYSFDRTYIAALFRRFYIWKATKIYPGADMSIFTGFDDVNYFSKKPSVLLCDWTLEFFIKSRLKREPYLLERCFIERQNKVLRHADLVVSLFPGCSKIIEQQVPGVKVNYLGGNVLNIIDKEELREAEILECKQKSNLLLFIGNIRYKSGAKKLIDAHRLLRRSYPDLQLAIIGMTEEELGIESDNNVRCYGYLHKNIERENQVYYKLLRNAKIIVNTNDEWAGFSSMIEAMYYYTPVIVTPYSEFVETFGEEISFGHYDANGTIESLSKIIVMYLQDQQYLKKCVASHNSTKEFTWDNYVNQLQRQIYSSVR